MCPLWTFSRDDENSDAIFARFFVLFCIITNIDRLSEAVQEIAFV